jgi:competence protein ComEA
MKRPIEYHMRFNKAERLGLIIILSFFLIIYTTKSFYEWHYQDDSIILNSTGIAEYEPSLNKKDTLAALGSIDPNKATKEELLQLGLPEKTIKTWINYRIKGGVFRKKEDVKKLYHLTGEEYLRIEPHLSFSKSETNPGLMSNKKSNALSHSKLRDSVFNPNDIDAATLKKMGFENKVSERWTKYIKKGGRFREENDLLKLYDIDTSLVRSWSKNWVFTQSDTVKTPLENKKYQAKYENISLEINSASEPEWQYLPGIGPGYARRIVSFRTKLGGFYAIDQVSETFGLPDSVFQQIKPLLRIAQGPYPIKINLVKSEELALHPYFPSRKAKLLCNYRDQHGAYQNLESIYKIQVLDSVWVEKIKPYLDFSLE